MAKRPGGEMIQTQLPTRSQLVPVITKWPELTRKSQLVPMIVTLLFVLLMYAFAKDNRPIPYFAARGVMTSNFIIIITVYLNLASFYFIYRLAGKEKSWLVLVGVALFTGLFMTTPIFDFALILFHRFLAGGEPNANQAFFTRLYKFFVAAGLFEELTKALPVFLLWSLGPRMTARQRERYGVEEPLDGILLGVASAAGFAIFETLGLYVTNAIVRRWVHYAAALSAMHLIPPMSAKGAVSLMSQVIGCAPGVQLAIPRSLDQAFGHMAYAGYFGYFIGLAAMKPEKRWPILAIGLSSAALLHGLWDAAPEDITMLIALIGVFSYAVLAAAILKAREISPRKGLLQASIIFSSPVTAGQAPGERQPLARQLRPAPRIEEEGAARSASQDRPAGSLTLKIGGRTLLLTPGMRLLAHQVPGLEPRGEDAVVAEVRCSPRNPSILGLRNLSPVAWEVLSFTGKRRLLEPGQTVRLDSGVRIDFGSLEGTVV